MNIKIRNRIRGVGDVFCRFPGAFIFVVAHPVQQIVEFAAPKSGIEDRTNLELRYTIHLDGYRDLHESTWECVGHMWLKKAYMEHGVDVRGHWKSEFVCGGSHRGNDSEGSKAPYTQFG